MQNIVTGNDFTLIVDARRQETASQRFDLRVLERLEIYLVMAGRAKVLQSYTLDELGRAVIEVGGDALPVGVWGVELVGTYQMANVRSTNAKAFKIVDGLNQLGLSGDGIEIVVEVNVLSNAEATRPYVDAAIADHDADVTSHSDIRTALAQKVSDIKVDGISIVDGNKVANLDSDDFGKVDDVKVNGVSVVSNKEAAITMPTKVSDLANDSQFTTKSYVDWEVAQAGHVDDVQVNGTSVVSGKVASVTIPTKVTDLTNDADYRNATQVQSAINTAIEANLINDGVGTVDGTTGTPSVDIVKQGTTLHFDFHNIKGAQGDRGEKGETGETGAQGDSVIVGEGDLPLANTMGYSSNKAITQKSVTENIVEVKDVIGMESLIDVNQFTPSPCSLGTGKWYKASGGRQSHIAIPTSPGKRYLLINNKSGQHYYAWMTSSYSPPYSNNATQPSIGSGRYTVGAGGQIVITAPDTAAWLILNWIDGAGTQSDWTLKEIGAERGIAAITEELDTLYDVKVLDIASEAYVGGYIDTTAFTFKTSSTYTGRMIGMAGLAGKRISIAPRQGSSVCRFAFLNAAIDRTNNANVPYCTGESLHQTAYDGYVPLDCKFAYFYCNSNGGNVTPTVIVYDKEEEENYINPVAVDLSSLTASPCSFGAYQFFKNDGENQSHVVIPVSPGETYKLLSNYWNGYAAVFTSSYSPPYANNDIMPVASTSARRIFIGAGGVKYITIPEDGAYLGITTLDGARLTPVWNIWKVQKAASASVSDKHPKVRVMHWNVGHWAMGTSYTSNLTPETYEAKKMAYRNMINEAKADIICCCEWSYNIVNAGDDYEPIRAKEALFPQYEFFMLGNLPSATSYMRTCQLANIERNANLGKSEIAFNNTVQSGRYYQQVVYRIGGKDVYVVATHLDWNQGDHGAEYRQSQMEQLMTAFADKEYAIICADWNCEPSEYDQWLAAGWSMVNHGYLGDFVTYSEAGVLDNIICKGFQVTDIKMYDQQRELSDHSPIAATLVMI